MSDSREHLRSQLAQLSDAQLLELSPLFRRERQAAEASLHEFEIKNLPRGAMGYGRI